MILGMQSNYTKYLNKANKANKKRDEICICTLGLDKKVYIIYEKREQAVSVLQQQTVKVKRYVKIIDVLQNFAFTKPDKLLSSIKTSINQYGSTFINALLPLVNSQFQSKYKCLT